MAKKRKGYVPSEEQKLEAKKRMEAYWEKRHKQEMALLPIRRICEAVYLAGWKQNKRQDINYRVDNQLSPVQATAELTQLFKDAFGI